MAEPKTKEGELTESDLAAYGIPPKQTDGPEEEIKERVADEAAEKAGKV
jgi:hypothetical protein